MNVAHPKNLVLAAAAALLAQFPAVSARAADSAPLPGQTVVVGETTSGDTKVILVEQIPKKPWETPAWAYPDRGLTFFPDGPGKGKDRWAIGGLWQLAPMFTANYTRGRGLRVHARRPAPDHHRLQPARASAPSGPSRRVRSASA